MEKKYVEASAIIATMRERAVSPDYFGGSGMTEAAAMLENAPAEDVAPVRRGKWIDNIVAISGVDGLLGIIAPDYTDGYKCSLCGAKPFEMQYPFCPYCGARMDAEQKEKVESAR